MSNIKTLTWIPRLALVPALVLAGCGKAPSDGAGGSRSERRAAPASSRAKSPAGALLTKEEVAAVLGQPVTSIEGTGSSLTYKTATLLLEVGIEVEQKDDTADALQSMAGARTATGFLGGKPEAVPGLGDEAFFGAMSFLYMRKGDTFVTITPPNLQQLAQMKAYEKVTQAKPGSDEQVKALEGLQKTSQKDPLQAGLEKRDAGEGAVSVVKAASKRQGTEEEAKARAMALALAEKIIEKL